MPRHRALRVSISSEQSNSSDQSDILNVSEEFPDAGLPGRGGQDAKKKKNVSFNIPVEVITSQGSFASTMDLCTLKPTFSDIRNRPRHLPKLKTAGVVDLTHTQRQALAKSLGDAIETTSKRYKGARKKETSADKKEAAAEKEAKKKKKEEEKQAKLDLEEMNKVFKPGECLKHINIEIHPELASAWYMADLPREASSVGINVITASDICDACAVMWTRREQQSLVNAGGQMKLSSSKRQCSRSLYVVTAAEIASLVAEHSLTEHMAVKRELIGGKLTLVVFGAQDYFKKSARKAANGCQSSMCELDFELSLTDLLVGKQIDTILTNTPNELALLIVQFTKAIAEEPYKRAKRDVDEQAQFYMRGDNKNCVTVDKYGNGLSRLWEQMIAVLPMSSLEVSRTIGAQYNTPRALSQELESAGGVTRIADVGVSRTNVPGARPRRLGPEFARKLHTLFTTEDGNMVIE